MQKFIIETDIEIVEKLETKLWKFEQMVLPGVNLDQVHTSWEDLIKSRMQNELGLIKNPSSKGIIALINDRTRKCRTNPKYFRDLINDLDQLLDLDTNFEILDKQIKLKLKNE